VLANTGLTAGNVANTANRAVELTRERFEAGNDMAAGVRLRPSITSTVK
jgi:hypothetical protein